MSKYLAVVVLVMLVLVGAMGLKNVVTAHGDGSPVMANGTGPVPNPPWMANGTGPVRHPRRIRNRSEEHTSELQSLAYLVCRLLLEKKKSASQAAHGLSVSCAFA